MTRAQLTQYESIYDIKVSIICIAGSSDDCSREKWLVSRAYNFNCRDAELFYSRGAAPETVFNRDNDETLDDTAPRNVAPRELVSTG